MTSLLRRRVITGEKGGWRTTKDGFEDGNYTSGPMTWTVEESAETEEVQTTTVKNGSYALHLQSSFGVNSRVSTPVETNTQFIQWWMRGSHVHYDDHTTYQILKDSDGNNIIITEMNDGKFEFWTDDAGGQTAKGTANTDTWYHQKISLYPGTGEVDCVVKDTSDSEQASWSSVTYSGTEIATIELSARKNPANSSYYDDVKYTIKL